MFNITPQLLKNIETCVDKFGICIVHGDGTCLRKETGSQHHVNYNSGVSDDEALNRASFRAIYKKGDKLPKNASELENAFYEQRKKDLKEKQENLGANVPEEDVFIASLPVETEEPKKGKKTKTTEE